MTHSIIRRLAPALLAILTSVAMLPAPSSARATTNGFYIVGFDAKITDESRLALASTGARILDYEHPNSYLVWSSARQARVAARLAPVAHVTPMTSARKIQDSLSAGGVRFTAEVLVYEDAAADALAYLRSFGQIVGAARVRADGALVAVHIEGVSPASISAIAAHDSVMYVGRASTGLVPEDEATAQIVAGNIDVQTKLPAPEYLAWLERMKLDGTGVRVAIVDTGIDENHPAFQDRVVEEIDYSLAGEPTDSYGHGTHVAGIVGGMPSADTSQVDSNGFFYGLGIAPKVEFVNQNAIGTTGFGSTPISEPWPPSAGLNILSADSWAAGAHMWNASWHTGEGNRPGYTASARTTDEMARNADFDKKGLEEFLLVFSAGNSGVQGPTAPKEAKNIIAVGATNSSRPTGLGGQGSPSDIDGVASFSSQGPTKDGRIFPTISAPGNVVVSARAYAGQACNEPPPDSAGWYAYCSGTSMAAPHVAGASALIHQWWKRTYKKLPSPTMVKSLFVNSATDMGPGADIPNILEGWGRINLGALFAKTPSKYVDQAVTLSQLGSKKSYSVKVKNTKRPLKITLSWADAPAAADAPVALVNDLDLVVQRVRGGRVVSTWKGNVFEVGQSTRGGKPDRLNNLENVFLLKPQKGTYRITIRAANLPGDGLPQNKDMTDQDFALVIRGHI